MPAHRACSYRRLLLGLSLTWLVADPTWAELYKCPLPDGRVSYQQTACIGQTEGETLSVDIRGPDGSETGSSAPTYTIEGQATRMRTERETLTRARLKARREAEAEAQATRTAAKSNKEDNPAQCAKHRSEAAKWKQKVMKGYRTRTDKEYNENKLAYHQAEIDRYCH